jgi:hypothetical protein
MGRFYCKGDIYLPSVLQCHYIYLLSVNVNTNNYVLKYETAVQPRFHFVFCCRLAIHVIDTVF